MEHEHINPKHLAGDDLSPYQRFMRRILLRLLEISTLELLIGVLHLAVTALAVFGVIGASGGGH